MKVPMPVILPQPAAEKQISRSANKLESTAERSLRSIHYGYAFTPSADALVRAEEICDLAERRKRFLLPEKKAFFWAIRAVCFERRSIVDAADYHCVRPNLLVGALKQIEQGTEPVESVYKKVGARSVQRLILRRPKPKTARPRSLTRLATAQATPSRPTPPVASLRASGEPSMMLPPSGPPSACAQDGAQSNDVSPVVVPDFFLEQPFTLEPPALLLCDMKSEHSARSPSGQARAAIFTHGVESRSDSALRADGHAWGHNNAGKMAVAQQHIEAGLDNGRILKISEQLKNANQREFLCIAQISGHRVNPLKSPLFYAMGDFCRKSELSVVAQAYNVPADALMSLMHSLHAGSPVDTLQWFTQVPQGPTHLPPGSDAIIVLNETPTDMSAG